jgi:hypothetical protein
MQWIVFTYSLPAQSTSSPRVAIWRRLRRLGAVTPAGGVYVLPALDECVEGFQWLAQEIRQAQGEALVMRVKQFEGLTDQQLVAVFQAAHAEEYASLEREATTLEQTIINAASDEYVRLQEMLDKLRRRQAEIARVDYFESPAGVRVAAHLARIADILTSSRTESITIAPVLRADYVQARWVTRPRPHVDRLACAWLIRQFINPDAVIRYATVPTSNEIAFDMPNAHFGHQGNLCTFETMLRAFSLDDAALNVLAEIVHDIDLRDGVYIRPEIAGIDAILRGWLLQDLTDAEREARGIALFDGLYTALRDRPTVAVEEPISTMK